MIANLASLAIMIAALLFMLSAVFGKSEAGQSLRRAAAFSFAMAFVPAVMVCLLTPVVRSFKPPFGSLQSFLAICGAVAILLVFAFAAYGFLEARRGLGVRQPAAHGEGMRHAKRRATEAMSDADGEQEHE
ncbi:MAG: hypothetical protein M3Q69_07830 [Acidobacteriota bacterium]|nr:hypothetical protein [Acidobacteriota bacterium]